ncbi:ubiquinol-cytochrome c reductase iron-sulfur subunit [Planctomyces sp. SH-PL14]|uniref:ubiquinol-cytochrome c reductase iron-sulfur subunit n=1 Tax=Planctomyces sp. SH-PL14 TaxID=1632864 RepID=UPI00078B3B7A|nr:Rieske (2Fe-2S) protein [Planctomyces sp. SH-PL14]AMV19717.1 Cytochrome b6-f complex iron-sulfur subunit [Planctomyces sp. SH-PL14]
MSKPSAPAPSHPSPPPHSAASTHEVPRRGVIAGLLAVLFGGLVTILPAGIGGAFFLDPLLRKKKGGSGGDSKIDADGFIIMPTAIEAKLPEDGTPQLFKVVADLQDAWNKFPNTEIGSVFLRKEENGSVSCFNSRCPHLGCTVNYKADEKKYICPCHDSAFSLDGTRSNEIPPRNLDSLEVKSKDGVLWVKFQNFVTGKHEKKPL